MFKLGLEKAEEPEIKFTALVEKQESSRKKTSTSTLLAMPKPLTSWITTNWKILREMGVPDHLTISWEICMEAKKEQLEKDMEQLTGSKLGK